MNFLSNRIEWVDPFSLSSNSYKEVLIAIHKHSHRDYMIVFGWVEPVDNYTDYKLMARIRGMDVSYPITELNKSEILAVGIFKRYGSLTNDE